MPCQSADPLQTPQSRHKPTTTIMTSANNNCTTPTTNNKTQLACNRGPLRVHGFMSELKQVGSDLAHKINLLTDIDEELGTALSRLEAQEGEIVCYRQQVYKLEADLKARNGKVKELERKVCEQQCQSQEALTQAVCELEAARCRVKQLEECVDEQKRHNCELNQRIEALKNKLRSSEKCAAYYRSMNASLNKTLESKRQIIEDLQQQTAQYLERVVAFEKAKVSDQYMDHCDAEDQLQAATMMLKEKDFEIAQLWENLQVLEDAVCENLAEIGVQRRHFTKDTLMAAAGKGGNPKQKPPPANQSQQACLKSCCNVVDRGDCGGQQQQQVVVSNVCMSPPSRFARGGAGKECNASKIEEVSRNLQNILEKVTELKKKHGGGGGAAQAMLTTGQGARDCGGGGGGSVSECNCGK